MEMESINSAKFVESIFINFAKFVELNYHGRHDSTRI